MKKQIAIILSMIMIVAMMPFSAFAANGTVTNVTGAGDVTPITNLTTEATKYETGDIQLTRATDIYDVTFSYTSPVDTTLCLEIIKDAANDKHIDDNSSYDIYLKTAKNLIFKPTDAITEDAAKSILIVKDTQYDIRIVRNYKASAGVTDPYIGINARRLPVTMTASADGRLDYTSDISVNGSMKQYYAFTPVKTGEYVFSVTSPVALKADESFKVKVTNNKTTIADLSYTSANQKYSFKVRLKKEKLYLIELDSKRSGENTLQFKAQTGSTGVAVTVASDHYLALQAETATEPYHCLITPFANADEDNMAISWYGMTVNASNEGYYQFDFTNHGGVVVVATLYTKDMVRVASDSIFDDDSTTFYARLDADEEEYILQLAEKRQSTDSSEYNVDVFIKKHTHLYGVSVDGNCVRYGCTQCDSDEGMMYEYSVDGVSVKNVIYTGKTAKPVVDFELDVWENNTENVPAIPEDAYTLTISSKNKSGIGAATAKIKFKGDYKNLGTYTESFKIIPKGTSISSLTAGSKSMTVKWKKQATKTTGYQIQYGTSSTLKNAKSVYITSNKTTSKAIKSLKSGKTYYARVRTYTNVDSKKYYSSWSAIKSVKVK